MTLFQLLFVFVLVFATACEKPKTPKQTFDLRTEPVVFGGPIVEVVAGTNFTCALSKTGSVSCWGEDLAGGGLTTTPRTVQTLPPLKTIAAGTYQACGVSMKGGVYCWGDSDGGPRAPKGVQVPESTAVGVGLGYACALATDGAVWCWGKNTNGQIPGANASRVKTPAKIDCGAGTALIVGPKNAAVLTKDGWCAWGDENPEMLRRKDNTTGPLHLSANPTLTMNVGTACHIDDGKVACWGTVVKQRTPDQPKETDDRTTTGIAVEGIAKATAISISDRFGCSSTPTELLCWGENSFGNLGDATRTSRGTAKPVKGLASVASFSTGDNHACAIDASSVLRCWGSNDRGQIGNGSRVGVNRPTEIVIGE